MLIPYERIGTIHKRNKLDIEVDSNGNVVSVWYNCVALPFEVHKVENERANEMRKMYNEDCSVSSIERIDVYQADWEKNV